MIQLPLGTRIWIAAGVTDMRRGFQGLSAQVQTVLEQQPFSGHALSFADDEETSSSASGLMATDFASLPSAWRRGALCGRRHRAALFHSRPRNCRCSSKGLTGGVSREPGNSRVRSSNKADSPVFIGTLWMHRDSIDAILRAWIALQFLIWTSWIVTR